MKTFQGRHNTAFFMAVCPSDKLWGTSLYTFKPVYLVIPIQVPGSAAILKDQSN